MFSMSPANSLANSRASVHSSEQSAHHGLSFQKTQSDTADGRMLLKMLAAVGACSSMLVEFIARTINGETKPMTSSQKCEYLMTIYQRKRVTIFGLFFVILLVEIVYLAFSRDRVVDMFSIWDTVSEKPIKFIKIRFIFFARVVLIFFIVLLLILMSAEPVSEAEQKFMHSVLFDQYLERTGILFQFEAFQDFFNTYAQRCKSEGLVFTQQQMTFMRIVCLSSTLHGDQSTISSFRTRGLMQLMFMRLWPMSKREKYVQLHVQNLLSSLDFRTRLSVVMRLAMNTSISELSAWMAFFLYLHTVMSDGAVTSTWIGVYEEMLRASQFSSWDVSQGQDPRYIEDLIAMMSDILLASLAFCSLFPIPVSACIILLLPVTLIVQTAFMTQPGVIQAHQLKPVGMSESQLYILVSFSVLQRHNLLLLRNYRNDYLISFRQRLNFLPQGLGLALANPARDRMLRLVQKICTHMTTNESPVSHDTFSLSLPHPSLPSSSKSTEHSSACYAISTLLNYLYDDSTYSSRVCDMSDICRAAIRQCEPLAKKHSVSLGFMGQQHCLPLRVLLVDDKILVRKVLERLARNRGYYFQSCHDGESCVKLFQSSLQCEPSSCSRFDLILMDKEMPTSEPGGFKTAGIHAVKKIRELSLLQAEVEPGFRCPCIIGNSACTDETDPTWIEFCFELQLAREQAGIPINLLILPEKLSSWNDVFDSEVRQLCLIHNESLTDLFDAPTVLGNPIRLEMMIRNLITNAIKHGKPSDGEHRVIVSYDLINRRSRMHPCLMLSDQDDEVARSLSWQLSHEFDQFTHQYVQVMVTDNGPGIDAKLIKRKLQLSSEMSDDTLRLSVGSGNNVSSMGSVSNFGICLKQIVCPEIANSHGAMGVHSRIEPSSGCSFVVALPYYSTCPHFLN